MNIATSKHRARHAKMAFPKETGDIVRLSLPGFDQRGKTEKIIEPNRATKHLSSRFDVLAQQGRYNVGTTR